MDKRLFYQLNLAQSNLTKIVNSESMTELGIPVAQNTALLALGKMDGCSLGNLGKALNISKSTVSALVDRMEASAIAVRKMDDNDSRSSKVYMTDKGRRILEQLKPLIADQNKRLKKGFTDDEISVVFRFLNHASKLEAKK